MAVEELTRSIVALRSRIFVVVQMHLAMASVINVMEKQYSSG